MDIIYDKTVTTHELVDRAIEKLIRRYENRGFRSGVPWGFQDIDAMTIDDSCMTFQALAEKCRRLKDRPEGLFLVVIDDLQQLLMREFATARNENQPELTKRLKALAQELEIAIVAMSQLTRAPEYRKNKRPILSDFGRGAGAPDNADIILFLYRDKYYYPEAPQRGVADLIIYRQKDGPTGTVELAYTVETGNFSDYRVHFANLYAASGEGYEITSKGYDDVQKEDEEEFPIEEG